MKKTSSAMTTSSRVASIEQSRLNVWGCAAAGTEEKQLLCALLFSQQQLNQSELWSPCSTLNPSVINQSTSVKLSLGFKRKGGGGGNVSSKPVCFSCSLSDFFHLQRRLCFICAGNI